MKTLLTAALALLLHVALGWAWTVLAAIAGGFWAGRRGWMVGAAGAGLSWGLLLAYSFAVAAGPTWAMAESVGGILGNLPGGVLVGLTLLVGVLLGGLGGLVGSVARSLTVRPEKPVAVLEGPRTRRKIYEGTWSRGPAPVK